MPLIFLENMNELFLKKTKKRANFVNVFQKVLDKLDCKPNKIWIDKRNEFYDSSFKKWF